MTAYCHTDAAEQASWYGDDIAVKRDAFEVLDRSAVAAIAFLVRRVGSHGSGYSGRYSGGSSTAATSPGRSPTR
jgi:hypothetical protein